MSYLTASRSNSRPWGTTIALFTASVVTLIGVARGLDPDVILLRAAGAALVLGVCTRILMRIGQALLEKPRQ